MIKSFFIHWLANSLALYGITYLLEGNFLITGGWKGYVVAALVIGMVNALIKPILKILSFPLVFMTIGLFSVVLNVLMLLFAKYLLSVLAFEGVRIEINGLLTYLFVAILISVANIIIRWIPTK